MKKILTTAMAIGVAICLQGTMASVFAESDWGKDHPRRHEVNKRLKNQDRRINEKVKEGKMSQARANKLHKEDRNIRQEERLMAKQNGGHITKQEQRTLNQQENKNSRAIN